MQKLLQNPNIFTYAIHEINRSETLQRLLNCFVIQLQDAENKMIYGNTGEFMSRKLVNTKLFSFIKFVMNRLKLRILQ